MRLRKHLQVLACLILFVPSLDAQAIVGDIRFTPPVFYVGDKVEMVIEFSLARPLAIEDPEIMPESDWAEILDIRVESSGNAATVMIDFIPFAPGTRTLPAMELGALQIRDLKVPTRSVVSGDYEGVRTPRGQLLLPGTRLAVALILALAAMAPFLGFGMVRRLWQQVLRLQEVWKTGRPARKLRRLTKGLRLVIGDLPAMPWFSQLTEALRTYMSSRLERDCRTATTAEIALMGEFRETDSPQVRLLNILHEGDMVKFAGQFADDRSLERTLDSVENAIQEWEKVNDQLQ